MQVAFRTVRVRLLGRQSKVEKVHFSLATIPCDLRGQVKFLSLLFVHRRRTEDGKWWST